MAGVLRRISVVLGMLFLLAAGFAAQAAQPKKPVIGLSEEVRVEEARLRFLARIDSGADGSAIHATSIRVKGRAAKMRHNVGKMVRFQVQNEKGEKRTLQRRIRRVVLIRGAGGEDRRYVVRLTIRYNGESKGVLVSLDNREKMSHKLLLGRNWLERDFLIDVDR
jgi:hypothetical protein